MITLYSIFAALLVLAIAACRWGVASSDGMKVLSGDDARSGLAFISSVADA